MDFHFGVGSVREGNVPPRRYISNLMFRLDENNFVKAISSIHLFISRNHVLLRYEISDVIEYSEIYRVVCA